MRIMAPFQPVYEDEPGGLPVRLPTARAFHPGIGIDAEQAFLLRHVGEEMGPVSILGRQGLDVRIRQPGMGHKR